MKKIILIVGILVAFTMCFSAVKATTDAEIQTAIDDGLAWLAAKQNTTPGPDYGSWGVAKMIGKTGLAVKKFEHDAILKGFPSPLDPAYPYHEVVQRGLNYLFLNASIVPISVQPNGDPDTDGDGIGVTFRGETYYTGIALMAIAESNCPECMVDVPNSPVNGWTYYDVAVDVMNWLAFAQIDAGSQRGSWGYSANSGGDQSNSGYATLGLGFVEAPAPHGFGIPVPQFVKDELGNSGLWIDYIQNDVDGDQYDGGSGYHQPTYYPNILQTGNLLFQMAWYGDNTGTQRVIDAIDYIVRHWTDDGSSWPGPQGWRGNYQAMFTMMKGLEAFGIDMIDAIDWFDVVSDTIVFTQHPNGSWGPDVWDCWPGVGCDTILSTAWALLTLQKVTPRITIPVPLDIKPTSCPNPFNMGSKGVLPVAILGTEKFDVMTVDPATVRLEGVAPLRWSYEDVATPVGLDADTCDCTTLGPDGYLDLTLKFDHPTIAESLGIVVDREERILFLTGMTYDSIPIEGYDCVVILLKGKGSSMEGSREFCESGEPLKSSGVETGLKSDVIPFMTIYRTDFVVAGFGGMRNTGLGDITLAGVSGTVTEAYLYWNGPTNSSDPNANADVLVNGTPVTGTNIGFSHDNCWGYDNTQAYRADVTALVQATGNGVYALTGFGAGPDVNTNGASLVVFFDDGDDDNDRDVVIFDGNDSNIDNPYDAPGWNVTLAGIDYESGTANMQLHVADGQEYLDDALMLNSLVLDPGPHIFEGNTVPSYNNGPIDNGNLWDIKNFDVTSFLTPGPNTLSLYTGVLIDCLGLVVAIIDLPAGAAPRVPVALDIKPRSCPNPFNMKAKGVLPVAILGTADFDVMMVDPSTIMLEGVPALRWSFEDVSTPLVDPIEPCECTTYGPDGYMDLTLKFDHQAIAAALGTVSDGDVMLLSLEAFTYDGVAIEGKDCIVIIMKGPSPTTLGGEAQKTFGLGEAYPNPFNPETDISFSLPEGTGVSLIIYNILGEKVKTLVNGDMEVGTHTIHWNGRDEAGNSVASGIYFYRLKTDSFDQTRKMVLMK